MFANVSQAQAFVADKDIRMVDLRFVDLWGAWHHVTVPAHELTPTLMEQGVGFDASSVGFKSIESSDMVLAPDPTSATMDPFCELPTLSFVCRILDAETREPFAGDPRAIVQKAEARLATEGIATRSVWGPEFEFYVLDSVHVENDTSRAGYTIESAEAGWVDGANGSTPRLRYGGGYHALPPNDAFHNLRSEMVDRLEGMGTPVRYHHHEVGRAGQCEIEIPLTGSLAAADAAMMVKYVTKMVARRHGKVVTYMPKPMHCEPGNGMHFHQSLWREDTNLFYDPAGRSGLSRVAMQYVGGLLKHGRALLAFTNPSTNSYRRLVPGHEAPIKLFFSSANRTAAIRLPGYARRPDIMRIEFRPPDATCNPYLAIAAQLMAGIDGIRSGIDPEAEGFGPFDENVFTWSPERLARIGDLPTSLGEALDALERDHEFLLAGGVFDDRLIETWVRRKRADEAQVRERPHPYEFEQSFDV